LLCPLHVRELNGFRLQGGGASPPDPLTRGFAPGPHWGLCRQIPVIGSRFTRSPCTPENCPCMTPPLFPVLWRRRCRAMLCISAAYAVMRCPSVCVCLFITFVDSVKTSNRIFQMFSPSVSQAILDFFTPNGMTIGIPLPGASNAGRVGTNRDRRDIAIDR